MRVSIIHILSQLLIPLQLYLYTLLKFHLHQLLLKHINSIVLTQQFALINKLFTECDLFHYFHIQL